MQFNSEQVESAVRSFYEIQQNNTNTTDDDRQKAHLFLNKAQLSPEAWAFLWDLLHPSKGTEIQFFAATTLHSKLRHGWHEVPADHYDPLKSRIFSSIDAFHNGPKIVLNRLCISLAAFILRRGGDEIMQVIEQLSTIDNPSVLLEVLLVIPEEFKSILLTKKGKAEVRNHLQELTPQIINLVMKYLCTDSESIQKYSSSEEEWRKIVNIWQTACQCIVSWLQLEGLNPSYCVPVTTTALQALYATYWWPTARSEKKRELSCLEIETCEAALNVAGTALTQPDARRYPSSCQTLLRLLLDATEPLLAAEDVLYTSNEELVTAIYSTLVSVGECHADWIALALVEEQGMLLGQIKEFGEEKNENTIKESAKCAQDLLKLMLRCSAAAGSYPVQEIHSQLTFGFWYILQDLALSRVVEIIDNEKLIKNTLNCWYEQLVIASLRKSTLPPPSNPHSAEDAELMRRYRQDVTDLFVFCNIILSDNLPLKLLELLKSYATSNLSDGGLELEAVLHAFLALAESSPSVVSLEFMNILIELPFNRLHPQVLITTLDCFGSYAEVLGFFDGEDAANIVGKALTITNNALEHRSIAPRAALALNILCRDCRTHLSKFAHQLLQAIQSKQRCWYGPITHHILGSASGAIATLPINEAEPYLRVFYQPIVTTLQITQKEFLSKEESNDCSAALRHANALLIPLCPSKGKIKSHDHINVPISIILPVLPYVSRHKELTEPLFNLIREIINNVMDDGVKLVPEFAKIVCINVGIEPTSFALEIAKMICIMFPEFGGEILCSICDSTLKTCKKCIDDGQSLSENASLLNSFYASLYTITMKKNHLLSHIENKINDIIQLAIMCLLLPENGPSRSVCIFLSQLAQTKPLLIYPFGSAIVKQAVLCIGVVSQRNHLQPFIDLFLGLGRAEFPSVSQSVVQETCKGTLQFSIWLQEALLEPNFPSERATPELKENFHKAIVKDLGNRRSLGEVITKFAIANRGLGEYGEVSESGRIHFT